MYVILCAFYCKMKLVVTNMVVLLFASEKIKIPFRKQFVGCFLGGFLVCVVWVFLVLYSLCYIFLLFRKFIENFVLLFLRSIKTLRLFVR